MADRTEKNQVFAQPDGTFTMEQTVEPVRVRRGGGWVDVDTKVRTRSDGRVEPAATVTPTVYSGGGTSPMAEFGVNAERLAVRWPTALPAPRLDAGKVVYPEVMPGVDLRMETFRQGFGYALIVKNAEAARNPAVRQLSLPVDGLTVRTENGVRTAYGPDGRAVYQSPTSVVQDSAPNGDPGKRRGLSAVSSADGRITITPDAKILDDPDAGFPIRIAEQWWPLGQFGWTSVYEEYRYQTYWNGANMGDDTRARSGYSGDWEYPPVKVRSFYHFDLRSMHGKHVLGAELNLLGGYSSTCDNSKFWLAHSEGVSPQTNWANQPGTGRVQERDEAGFGRVGCGPRWVGWDVGADVYWSNHVQPADYVTFRLSGPEGDKMGWRKWDTTSYGEHPKLLVKFNQYPNTPGNLTAAPKPGCAQEPDEPYVTTNQPVLKATVSDPDGGRVSAVFEMWDRFGAIRRGVVVGEHESGSQFQLTVPGDLYRDGSKIAWRVKARDPHGAESAWSQWCDITVDRTAPDRKPEVFSTDYPEGVSSGSPGRSGRFYFSAANLADAAGFRYRVGGQGWKFTPALNGSATVDIAPVTADPVRLDVTIEDRAGNIGQDNELRPELSNVRKYEIRVNGPTPPASHWKLDGFGTATDAGDSTGTHPGTFPPGKAGWTKGKAGDALAFRGAEQSFVSTTGGPAVGTAASFTVAAWVRLDAHPGTTWRTAVSQDGVHVSRFALQFKGESTQRWAFSMMSNDSTAPRIDSAVATDDRLAPQVGQWTHLAGVYDVTDKKIRLYVNGVLAGEQAHDGLWWSDAPNALQIARGKWADNVGDYFPGAIDDVRVYDRALNDIRIDNGPSELDELAQVTAPEAIFSFDENTGTVTRDATGAPRTATLAATSWAPGKDGTAGFRFDGHPFEGTNHAVSDGPVVRTDDSYTVSAWVKPERFAYGARTVLAQSAGTMSGFYLQYRFGPEDAEPSWNFFTPETDTPTPAWAWVRSPAKVAEGQWTHLAAVYDESVPELRLYVNGVQSGAPAKLRPRNWNATGPLQIGRAKYANRMIDAWIGGIDEVRVHSGVRSAADISAEVATSLPDRKRLPAHGRYFDHRGDHRGGNGPMPREYRLENTIGYYVPAGTPGTHMLYSCITVTTAEQDSFTTAKPDCGGAKLVGPLGLAYDSQPAGVRANRLTRCKTKQGWQEYFDSVTSDCEGQTLAEELGYLLPYTTLTRYQQTDGGADRRGDTGNVPVGYRPQRDLVALHLFDGDGRVPLVLCRTGTDTHAEIGPDCAGKDPQLVERLGWVWPHRPADPAAKELFACAEVSATRERFESTDSGCEGQDVLGSLGFGIDPARVTTG